MQQDNSSFWTDIKAFEEQLAKEPNSFCFVKLSEVYLKVGLIDDALHTARQGVAIHPGYLGGQRALALACHAKGLNDECLAALKLVTVGIPEDQQAQKLLGRLLADSGDRDAAMQAFKTVLEFVPDDVGSRMELESLEIAGGLTDTSLCADEDEEEIIEDLELLEEIDVLEEDESVSEPLSQEPPLGDGPTAVPFRDPLFTATLAEQYVRQGIIEKALEIYQSILAADPANSAVSIRIAELVQPESVSAAVKPQGIADNGLSTLEEWLENIRRIKSCR